MPAKLKEDQLTALDGELSEYTESPRFLKQKALALKTPAGPNLAPGIAIIPVSDVTVISSHSPEGNATVNGVKTVNSVADVVGALGWDLTVV